jgi:acyl carrier protein
MTTTEQSIAEFIQQLAFNSKSGPLMAPQESLLDAGILDSLALQQLVQFIQDAHGVTLGEEHYSAENFETIGALASLVDQLRS